MTRPIHALQQTAPRSLSLGSFGAYARVLKMKALHFVACISLAALTAFGADESPIKSSSTSTDISPKAIATAAEQGTKNASADIAAGRLRILEYGEPRQITEATKDPETGFGILSVAGCKVPALVRAEADAYNRAMRDWHAKNVKTSTPK